MIHDYLEGNIVRDISNGQEMKITTVRKGLFDDAPSGYVVCEWEEDGTVQKGDFHVDNIEFVSEGNAKPYDIDKHGSCDSSSKRELFTLILFLLFGLNANAYDFATDYIYYNKLTDNEVEVTNIGTEGSYAGSVNIPKEVKHEGNIYKIRKIGSGAFKNCTALFEIKFPQSLKEIGYGAFDGCTNLQKIEFPDSLTYIGQFSFDECCKLQVVEIPDLVKSVDNYAFRNCTGLKKIIFGRNVKYIGDGYTNCSNLDTIICKMPNPQDVNLRMEVYLSHTFPSEFQFSSNKILCVPFNSIDLYKSANVWKDFKNIQELKFRLTLTVDGIKYSEDSVAFGAPIVYPEIEKKEDHELIWENTLDEMPTNDLVINGYYKVNTYYLTYMIDGVEYKKEKVVIGTPLNLMDNPTKEGHTFSGWSEIPSTMPEENVTITGSFTKNTYKLTYMVDGMVYMSSYVTYGDAIFPMTPPAKEGYIFSGWSEIPKTMPAHDVVVTGSFEVNGIDEVMTDTRVDVYNLQGIKVQDQVLSKELEKILPQGMYIVNRRKLLVK